MSTLNIFKQNTFKTDVYFDRAAKRNSASLTVVVVIIFRY